MILNLKLWQCAPRLSEMLLRGHTALMLRQFSLPSHALCPPAHIALYKLKLAHLACLELQVSLAYLSDLQRQKEKAPL